LLELVPKTGARVAMRIAKLLAMRVKAYSARLRDMLIE
jgi:hypothetical protein